MRTLPTIDLDRLDVAAPCSADWNAMSGDARVRHCGDCRKNVYELTDLTRAEIHSLVAEHEGDLCVRFYRRADGTVLTADCPVGLAARLRRRARLAWSKVAALVLFALPAFATSGCRSDRVQGKIDMGDLVMGEVECVPPPQTPPPRELGKTLHELQADPGVKEHGEVQGRREALKIERKRS